MADGELMNKLTVVCLLLAACLLLPAGMSADKTAYPYQECDDLSVLLDPRISDSQAESILRDGAFMDMQDSPVLGWSRQGKIAFIRYWEPREPIGTLSDMVIVDLVTDQEIFRISLYNGSDSLTPTGLLAARKALRTYGIQLQRTQILSLPLVFKGQSLSLQIEGSHLTGRWQPSGRHKIISTLSQPERFSIQGYALSPWEDRIAVLFHMSGGPTIAEIAQYESYSSFLGCHLVRGFK